MRMVWLKLYDEILEDRKVQTLSGDTFKFWVNVLAIANRQKVRGVLPPVEDVAFLLRLSVQEATANLAQLVSLGILDETTEGLSPHNWAERQKKSDATSTERSRKHREKRDSDATRSQRVPRPSATTGDKNATKCNAQRRERLEEERNTPLTPNGGKSEQGQVSRQPISIEAEPFDSGQSNPLPKALPPKATFENDPAEIARLVAKAESIFRSNFDVGMSVHEAAGKLRADWIDEALDIAREKNAQGWAFVRSVFTRFKAQGMSDSEKQARDWDKKQKTSLWNQPSHVPEPDPKRPKMRSINALSADEILEFRQRGVA